MRLPSFLYRLPTRLLLWSVVVSFLGAGALTFAIYNWMMESFEENALFETEDILSKAVLMIETSFQDSHFNSQILSDLPSTKKLVDRFQNREAFSPEVAEIVGREVQSVMTSLIESWPQYRTMVIVSLEDEQTDIVRMIRPQGDVPFRREFAQVPAIERKTLDRVQQIRQPGRFVVGEFETVVPEGHTASQPYPVMTLAYPLFMTSNGPRAAIVTTIDIRWHQASTMLRQSAFWAFVCDPDGNFRVINRSGVAEIRKPGDMPILTEYLSLPDDFYPLDVIDTDTKSTTSGDFQTGVALQRILFNPSDASDHWIIGVVSPPNFVWTIAAPFRHRLIIAVTLFALATIISTAAVFHHTLGDAEPLTEAAKRMAAGETDVTLPRNLKGELAVMSQAFQELIEKLRSSQQDLQKANTRLEKKLQRGTDRMQSLAEEIGFLSEVVEASATGIIATDDKRMITYVNPEAADMYGYATPQDLRDQPLEVLGEPERGWSDVENALQSKGYWEDFVTVEKADGEIARYYLAINRAQRKGEHEVGVIVSIQDATKEYQTLRALAESEGKFQSLVNSMDDFVFTLDKELRIIGIHGQLLDILGSGHAENYVGKHIDTLFEKFGGSPHGEPCKKALTGAHARYEFEYEQDGRKVVIQNNVTAVRDRNGDITGVVGVGRDVTKLKEIEQALRESEDRYRSLVSHNPNGMFVVKNQVVIFANQAAIELFGATSDRDLIGAKVQRLFQNIVADPTHARIDKQQFDPNTPRLKEIQHFKLVRIDGRRIDIELHLVDVTIDGEPATLYDFRNITQRLQTQQTLTELSNVVMRTSDTIIITNKSLHVTYVNQAFERKTGYKKAEVLGKHIEMLYPAEEQQAHLYQRLVENIQPGKDERGVFTVRTEDGATYYEERTITAMTDETGAIESYFFVGKDVTEQLMTNRELSNSIKEKEILLREVHHRVKNNLQVIASLLKLQARAAQNPEFRDIVQECWDRINSMVIIHERLYQSDNLGKVDFRAYVKQLVQGVRRSYALKADKVSVNIDVEKLRFSLTTAIPCGLLINELVSNAFKHAFPGDAGGTIEVRVRAEPDGTYFLQVEDNGVGMPAEVNADSGTSLGLWLIETLSKEQLEGEMNLDVTRGTCFTLRFKEISQPLKSH